jgi:fatty acid desaturase
MTETPATSQAPAAQPAAGQQPPAAQQAPADPGQPDPGQGDAWSTAGTVLMVAALVAAGVILLDFALKGRLLGPIFARLGAPAPPPPAEAEAAPLLDDVPADE